MRCETCGYTLPEGTETCPICGRPCTAPAPQGGHSSESAAFFDAILPPSEETDSAPDPPEPSAAQPPGIQRSRRWLWTGLLAGWLVLAVLAVLLILRPWHTEPKFRGLFWLRDGTLWYTLDGETAPAPLFTGIDHAGTAVDGQGRYAYVVCAAALDTADGPGGLYRVALDQLTADLEQNRPAIVQVDPDIFFYPGDFDWHGQIYPLLAEPKYECTFALTPDGTVFYRTQTGELRGYDGTQRWAVAENVNFFSLSEDGSQLLITQYERYDEMAVSLRGTDPDDTAIQEVSWGKTRLLSGNEDFSALLFTDSYGTPYNLYAYRQGQRELLVAEAQEIVYAQAPDTYAYTRPSPPQFSSLFLHEDGREVQLCSTAHPFPHYEHGVLFYTTFDPTDNQVYLAFGDITGELWRERNGDCGYAFTPDQALLILEDSTLTRYQRRDGYREGVVLAQDVFSACVPQEGKAIYYSVLTGGETQDLYRLDGSGPVQVIACLSGAGFFYPDGGIAALENGALTYYAPEGTSYSYGAASEEGFCRLEGDRFLTQEDGVLTLWEGSDHWILGESVTGFYAPGQQDYLYAF